MYILRDGQASLIKHMVVSFENILWEQIEEGCGKLGHCCCGLESPCGQRLILYFMCLVISQYSLAREV